MKKTVSVLSLCLFVCITLSYAQTVGKTFPELKGENLEDKTVNLPSDTKGKFTLIGLACSRAAEADMQKWLNPLYNKFVLKTSGMMDPGYDVPIFFVPIYSGLAQVTTNIGKKNMRESTDKIFYPYLVYYKGGFKKHMQELDLKDKETPYFLLLDKDGKVIYCVSGKYTDDKLSAIEDKLN